MTNELANLINWKGESTGKMNGKEPGQIASVPVHVQTRLYDTSNICTTYVFERNTKQLLEITYKIN